MAGRTLNHFALYRFRDAYYALSAGERASFNRSWLADLCQAAPAVEVYQVFPARADASVLVWSALPAEANTAAGAFFERHARAINPRGLCLEAVASLWGFTRPSQYARGGSARKSWSRWQGRACLT